MRRQVIFYLFMLYTVVCAAQGGVRGKVVDKNTNSSMPFVNVAVYDMSTAKFVKGVLSDEKGLFFIDELNYGYYKLELSYMGYKTLVREFEIEKEKRNKSFKLLYMTEDATELEEVTVTAQRSPVRLEVDRKSFDVSQDILNAGGAASDVLENIPSVEVDTDGNISLRGNTSVEVWINGKSSGLTSDNRAEILQQLPAESIDRIEVIDNPSAKFSAEGSAGIINIVLKKDRKAGYYGSVQAGGDSRGGANTSANINFNTGKFEGYANVGYRHRNSDREKISRQSNLDRNTYENYNTNTDNRGNNLFTRAGLTYNPTKKDALSVSGMMMLGGRNSLSETPYHYGALGTTDDTHMMLRRSTGDNAMRMLYGEFNYRHSFTDKHFLDFVANFHSWKMDADNIYQDSTEYYNPVRPTEYMYEYRPMRSRNKSWEVKLDYENPITDKIMLQAGYQGRFSRENSPQESYADFNSWEGTDAALDEDDYNRFIYDMDLHAMYATATMKFGRFGVMGGLRGEYWKVKTESLDYLQDKKGAARNKPFEKDFFELFPSVFLSYQLTDNDQLQLNYTRRLRRPWGGQLNSFKNTSDASMVSMGNPELTPEFSNSFSFNYLRTWTQHSLLLSAYYRPTSDVMQHISYRNAEDGLIYMTHMNVTKSVSSGLELVLKNKLFKWLDLTTTANAYYYDIDGFEFDIDGQKVTADGDHNFTWNARMQAAVMLPYDISFQLSGRYRSRQVITQGVRKANYSMDLGVRKTFLNKALTLAINCRDLLDSRKFETITGSESFTRHQKSSGSGRNVNMTLTWNFGNMKAKPSKKRMESTGQEFGGGEDGMGGEM